LQQHREDQSLLYTPVPFHHIDNSLLYTPQQSQEKSGKPPQQQLREAISDEDERLSRTIPQHAAQYPSQHPQYFQQPQHQVPSSNMISRVHPGHAPVANSLTFKQPVEDFTHDQVLFPHEASSSGFVQSHSEQYQTPQMSRPALAAKFENSNQIHFSAQSGYSQHYPSANDPIGPSSQFSQNIPRTSQMSYSEGSQFQQATDTGNPFDDDD
jgi:hypothetical protein